MFSFCMHLLCSPIESDWKIFQWTFHRETVNSVPNQLRLIEKNQTQNCNAFFFVFGIWKTNKCTNAVNASSHANCKSNADISVTRNGNCDAVHVHPSNTAVF